MRRISVGQKLYLSVLLIFLIFALSFIIFQQRREESFKVQLVQTRLQDYNARLATALGYRGGFAGDVVLGYLAKYPINNLRVTVIDPEGKVIFDNERRDYSRLPNHLNRKEVADAIRTGEGIDISRTSESMGEKYFYSATCFKDLGLIIRTALPYNDELVFSLQTDQHYIWFAIAAVLILIIVLYRFVNRLGDNITKLRAFASQADQGGSLDTEDLVNFPDDELGEIAERIVKIYKRLQSTKKEQSNLKKQLTQNIAHELKTPVASIQGYMETIIENPHLRPEQRDQFLQRCYAQSRRLTTLLQDISTLNRIDDAPEMIEFGQVDIARMVDGIIRETALQAKERRMTFHNGLPSGLVVQGNSSLLYSVFRNLADNAIAYAGDDTTVTITAERDGKLWRFCFSDNGAGIAAVHLPRIFERFYRVDKGRSRKMGGTGLGLAIVKNAVMLHGGTISALNNEGGGMRFVFTIDS